MMLSELPWLQAQSSGCVTVLHHGARPHISHEYSRDVNPVATNDEGKPECGKHDGDYMLNVDGLKAQAVFHIKF